MVRVQSGPPPPPPVPTTVLDIPPPVSGAERNPEFRNSAERENSAMREAIAKNNAVFKQNIRLLNEMHVKLLKMDQVNDGLKKENQELKAKGASNNKEAKKKDKKEKEAAKNASKDKDKKSSEPSKSPPAAKSGSPTPPPVPSHKTPEEVKILELVQKVEQLELKSKKSNDELKSRNGDVETLERDLEALKAEHERLRKINTATEAEKWELSAANTELKNRLQQTMAMNFMQSNDMIQEELHKMQMALAEERKVTEKLSRNLELEKRRVESLEQKAKSSAANGSSADKTGCAGGIGGIGGGGESGSSGLLSADLPDEVKARDGHLATSMERFRLQCDNLGSSLEECEEKLSSFEIQEDYHVADLKKELHGVKKLLLEERKKSGTEAHKLLEQQSNFGQVLRDYKDMTESLKKEAVKASRAAMDNNVDALTAQLMQSDEHLREERVRARVLEDKVKRMELDQEAIPILKAQVEVYQADFNAERSAREKIAGEKADLEEQIRKIRQRQDQLNDDLGALQGPEGGAPVPIGLSSVRNRVNQLDQMQSSPAERSDPEEQDLQCPFCQAPFAQLEPLQAHVNQCLDQK